LITEAEWDGRPGFRPARAPVGTREGAYAPRTRMQPGRLHYVGGPNVLYLKVFLGSIVHLKTHGVSGWKMADSETDLFKRFGNGDRAADAGSDGAAVEAAGVVR
jgi:hypothetical protein